MIFELLDTGEKNARTAKELARALNTSPRAITSLVEGERRAGKPICATCDNQAPGYYIPATRADMERYCSRLQHRAGEIYKTRAACLGTLDSLPEAAE